MLLPALPVLPVPSMLAAVAIIRMPELLVMRALPAVMVAVLMLAPFAAVAGVPPPPFLIPGAFLALVVPPKLLIVVALDAMAIVGPMFPFLTLMVMVVIVMAVVVVVAVMTVGARHERGLGVGHRGGDDDGDDEGGELNDGSDLHDVWCNRYINESITCVFLIKKR